MGINKISLMCIASLSLILIFLIGSFLGLLFDDKFYSSLYEKTGTYERIEKDIVNEKTLDVYEFFNGKKELDTKFYTVEEISHMQDVRNLIKRFTFTYYLAIIFFIASILALYFFFRNTFTKDMGFVLVISGGLTIILVLLFYISSFTNIFDSFHKMFFQGNYLFAASSHLIQMWNEEFFYLFAQRIFVISLIKGFVGSIIGILLYKIKN